jgi:hypothetical protein
MPTAGLILYFYESHLLFYILLIVATVSTSDSWNTPKQQEQREIRNPQLVNKRVNFSEQLKSLLLNHPKRYNEFCM